MGDIFEAAKGKIYSRVIQATHNIDNYPNISSYYSYFFIAFLKLK